MNFVRQLVAVYMAEASDMVESVAQDMSAVLEVSAASGTALAMDRASDLDSAMAFMAVSSLAVALMHFRG